MLEKISQLARDPLSGYALFSISLLATLTIYFKQKRVRQPKYTARSINIVRDLASDFEGLQITHHGQRIPTVTFTKLAFWNAGRDTINASDVASSDPITIMLPKGEHILDAKIIFQKRAANAFKLIKTPESHLRHLEFDFIDHDDGVVLSLLHTGTSSREVEVSGSIKGARQIQKVLVWTRIIDSIIPQRATPKARRRLLSVVCFLTPILMWCVLFLPSNNPQSKPQIPLYIIFGALTVSYWSLGYSISRRRIPKGFDVFEEEFGKKERKN